jgi:hypothetical protein
MGQKTTTCKAMLPLIAALLVLPIAICVLIAISALLCAMGDAIGGMAIKYVALGCGILWIVGFICVVLLQGFHYLGESYSAGESHWPDKDEIENQ